MRIKSCPALFALFFTLLLTAVALPARVRAQGSTAILDAPWLSFDTGWFAPGFEPEGFSPAAFEAADLDRDGDIDLVTGNWGSTKPGISVLTNTGDGNYNLPVFYYLPTDKSVADVALADVDKDGDTDVLATAPDYNGLSNILALWRNDGDGTFAPFEQFAAGPGPKGLAVADFNGDGFPDAATANHGRIASGNHTFSVVLHNGLAGSAAGFRPPSEFDAEGIVDAQRVAAADLNGDGRPDLAVAGKDAAAPTPSNPAGGKINVYFNDGAGGFRLSAAYVSYPGSRLPSVAVAFSDLDKDGDADLVAGGMVTNGTDDRGLIAVRRNNGDGTFGAPVAHVFESNVTTPHRLAVGDLNKDTYPDVVALTPSGRTMDGYVVLLSDGAGGFKPTARYESSQMTVDAALFDADRDGDADVVTLAQAGAAAAVHRNNGDGSFPVLPRIPLGREQNGLFGNGFSALEAGDIDNDGDPDLVAADAKSWIIKNNGDSTFAEPALYEPPINPGQVKLRDLNGDGHLDLLFGSDPSAAPYHFGSSLNNGDGTFAPGTVTYVNACGAGSIEAADFDRDGDLDVVLTEEGACMGGPPPRVFIFRNDGRGAFTLATTVFTACGSVGVGVGDFNGDHKLDFVGNNCNKVGVWPGNGDLTFGPVIESSEAYYRFKLADFNSDGRPDIATILTQTPSQTTVVGTALGNGDGTFTAPRKMLGASGGEGLTVSSNINTADLDGDGDQDVLVANAAPNDLSLFYNEDGRGTLTRHERYGVGSLALHAAPADYNMDGAVDVASGINLPPYGALTAVVVLRNRRFDLIGEPFVRVTSPENGATFQTPSSVRIAADARPVPGRSISKVEFYISEGEGFGWKLVHTDTTFPYGPFELTGQAPGRYNVYAIAYDADNSGISSSVSYFVQNPPRRFAISGKVTDTNGAPLAGAEVSVFAQEALTTTTAADGTYRVGDLVEGETYGVNIYLDQYVFTPPSAEITNLSADQTVNFVGRIGGFRISGRLTHNGQGIAGATVRLTGTSEATITTGADGAYEFANLPGDSNVKVTPTHDSYVFTPTAIGYPALRSDETAGFTATPLVNLAQGKPATQSSDLFGGVASRAVDGNTSGAWGGGSVTHTNNQAQPWWQVDLGAVQQLRTVRLWNRTDCCSNRLSNFYVLVSDTPFASTSLSATLAQPGVSAFHTPGTAGTSISINVNRTGRYVRVQLASSADCLALAEVEVLGVASAAPTPTPTPTPTNLALGRPATQSSDLLGGVASRAADGDTNGVWSSNSVTHTDNQAQPWWEVDLGAVQQLQTVRVWNRTDCCSNRLSNFYVLVSDTPFASTSLSATLSQPGVSAFHVLGAVAASTSLAVNRTGRYVRVQLAAAADYLSLAEVEVLGGAPTPTPTNLALGRPATQSSDLLGGAASRAADGNTDGAWASGSVTHTNNQAQPWWEVDLGVVQQLQTVKLWNRTDCCSNRLANFYVLVSDVPFTSTSLSATLAQPGVSAYHTPGQAGASKEIGVNRTGRYVRVQLAASADYLSLAEIEVLGAAGPGPVAAVR